MQNLIDENFVRVEKIGTSNWYWSFLSETKKSKQRIVDDLQREQAKLTMAIESLELQIKDAVSQREEDAEMLDGGRSDRQSLLDAESLLKSKVAKLENALAEYSDNDPIELEQKEIETKLMRDSAIRWTDNLEAVESYLTRVTSDKAKAQQIMHSLCSDEYVVGEGFKEL
jgi:chromosome segregation ATPase